MNIHKVLRGEGAERYLPFALAKLRMLMRTSSILGTHRFATEDATISITYNPLAGQHHIYILADGGLPGYEFVSTDGVTAFVGDFPWEGKRISGVRYRSPAAPGVAKGVWSGITPTFAEGKGFIVANSPTSRAINLQGNAQYVWYPRKLIVDHREQVRTKDYFMTSAAGAFAYGYEQYDDQGMFEYTALTATALQNGMHAIYGGVDIAADIPYTVYSEKSILSLAPKPVAPHWWRRGAVIEKDGRKFVVMTDMQSNFRIVPLTYGTEGDDFLFPADKGVFIPASSFLPDDVVVPTVETMMGLQKPIGYFYGDSGVVINEYPGWDYGAIINYNDYDVDPGADPQKQFQKHHYLWNFHPDGSKAAAVVHTDLRTDLTVAEITAYERASNTPPSTHTPFRRLKGYMGYVHIPALSRTAYAEKIAALGGLDTVDVTKRAVVEVSINITVTGPGEDDFTATVTPAYILRNRWYVGVGYTYNDSRIMDKGFNSGSLITSELRMYARPTVPGNWESKRISHVFRVIRNVDSGLDCMSFCVAKNFALYQKGSYKISNAFNTGFPDYPTLVNGPYGVLESKIPGPPHNDYSVYMNALYKTDQPNQRATYLDTEDLPSLTWTFAGFAGTDAAANPVNKTCVHTIAFGETLDSVPEIEAFIHTTEADALAAGLTLVPADYTAPATYKLGDGTVVDLPETDISIAYNIGLYRNMQVNLLNATKSDFNGSLTNIASHPDGHVAFVVHDAPGGGSTASSDRIRYRAVTKTVVGDITSYSQAIKETRHIDVLNASFGLTRTLDGYAEQQSLYNDPTANVQMLMRFGCWRNIRLKRKKSYSTAGMNPRFL